MQKEKINDLRMAGEEAGRENEMNSYASRSSARRQSEGMALNVSTEDEQPRKVFAVRMESPKEV